MKTLFSVLSFVLVHRGEKNKKSEKLGKLQKHQLRNIWHVIIYSAAMCVQKTVYKQTVLIVVTSALVKLHFKSLKRSAR